MFHFVTFPFKIQSWLMQDLRFNDKAPSLLWCYSVVTCKLLLNYGGVYWVLIQGPATQEVTAESWRWRHYCPQKHLKLFTSWHCITFQKTWIQILASFYWICTSNERNCIQNTKQTQDTPLCWILQFSRFIKDPATVDRFTQLIGKDSEYVSKLKVDPLNIYCTMHWNVSEFVTYV
jgi:hypothetical protein